MDTKDWIQIASTLILAGTAYLAPYLIEKWKYSYRAPKLVIKFKLAPPDCHLTQAIGPNINYPVYYFRFLVKNIGRTQAEDCEVFLEKIYKENKNGKMVKLTNFTPVNLKWSGIREQFKRSIQPEKQMYCDIGKIQPPNNMYVSQYRGITETEQKALKFIFELPEIYYSQWDCLVSGKYILTISVYSKNAEKVTRNFKLSWSGKWKDNEVDMFDEIVIS